MELNDIRNMYRDPPAILCVGLVVLCAGVLLCMFGAAIYGGLFAYMLLVVPLLGVSWMSFGLVKMHLIQKGIDDRLQAQKEKERRSGDKK